MGRDREWVTDLFFAHSGLKWTVRQMAPPLYIFAVFPSSSGIFISGAVVGYVAGISNSKANSYFCRLWMYQHLPFHCRPSLLLLMVNQSESEALFNWMYLQMTACCNTEIGTIDKHAFWQMDWNASVWHIDCCTCFCTYCCWTQLTVTISRETKYSLSNKSWDSKLTWSAPAILPSAAFPRAPYLLVLLL